MKNLIFKAALSLALLISLTNCSSDSDDPIITECPIGYTGTNCDIPITPKKIKISKIVLRLVPYVDSNSNTWDNWLDDTDVWPDVFTAIASSTQTLLISDVVYDVNQDSGYLTITPNQPLEMPSVNQVYALGVFDYDGGEDYETMSETYFSLYDPSKGFPQYITVVNNSQPTIADIYLTYEW